MQENLFPINGSENSIQLHEFYHATMKDGGETFGTMNSILYFRIFFIKTLMSSIIIIGYAYTRNPVLQHHLDYCI